MKQRCTPIVKALIQGFWYGAAIIGAYKQEHWQCGQPALFPRQSCPWTYHEDCRPAGKRVIGDCPRLEELGFTSPRAAYTNCSDICEKVVKVAFGWKPARSKIEPCPPPLDTSEHFGANVVLT